MLSDMETDKSTVHSPRAALILGALLVVLLQRFLSFGPLVLYPVSYTHLDGYKRQELSSAAETLSGILTSPQCLLPTSQM